MKNHQIYLINPEVGRRLHKNQKRLKNTKIVNNPNNNNKRSNAEMVRIVNLNRPASLIILMMKMILMNIVNNLLKNKNINKKIRKKIIIVIIIVIRLNCFQEAQMALMMKIRMKLL